MKREPREPVDQDYTWSPSLASIAESRPSGITFSMRERFMMRKKLLVLAFSALIAAGCSTRQAMPSLHGAAPGVGNPNVRQTGEKPVNWRRFHWGGVAAPFYPMIVTGPDKAMWYTDYSDSQVIRMTMVGSVTRTALPSFNPTSIAVGFDNKLYIGAQPQSHLDIVTTGGVVNQIGSPSSDVASYDGITLGPDHNIWVAENSHVAKITTAPVETEVAYTDHASGNSLGAI